MLDRKAINRGAILFVCGVIGTEIYQYVSIADRGFLSGDFTMPVPETADLSVSLGISIAIWIATYVLYMTTRSIGPTRVHVEMTPAVLLLFVFNFVITVWGNIGYVQATSKNPLSFLTTLIPINYLILVVAQQQKLSKKFFLAAAILAVIDLFRLLLGAVFKLGYIMLMRASRKMLVALVLTLPLSVLALQTLVAYKFESRGAALDNVEQVVFDVITSRIATLSTVHYMTAYDTGLAEFCHRAEYASPWYAASLSVIPKGIFGLDYVKTYNNCLIEFHLARSISDSSVNSPWLLTLYIEALSGPALLVSYLLLTVALLFAIIKIANYLFGANGDIFKLWVIFEFMWTGNILHLTIPLYFLCLLLVYLALKKCFPRTPTVLTNERAHGAAT